MPSSYPLLTALAVATVLSGCGKTKTVYVPAEKSMVLTPSNDRGKPPCECPQAQTITLTNPDDSRRYAEVEVITTESATGNQVGDDSTYTILPDQHSQTMGCSVEQNPTCKFAINYRIVSEGRLYASNTPLSKTFGPFFSTDISTCYALCNDPNDTTCLRLGSAAVKVTQPIVTVYQKAIKSGNSEISPAEIASAYSKPNDNVCHRGSITISGDAIQNKSADADANSCFFSTDEMNLQGQVAAMQGILPPTLLGHRQSSIRLNAQGTEEHLRFDDRDLAPKFLFNGEGGDLLTKLYGGAVKTMSVVGDKAYFASANGCMMAPVAPPK